MTEQNPVPPPPPGDPTPPASYEGPAGIEQNPQARQWAMFAHLSAIAGSLVGLPIVGPIIVWAMKKQEFPFVDDQGKEAINFNITVLIGILICIPLMCVGIGFFLLPVLGIAVLVFSIIAGIKANEGVAYRYPLTIRFIK